MHRGFVKLYRKILDSEIFFNPEHLQLFLYLLLRANHEKAKVRGIEVQRGEHLTGRKVLAANLNQKESTIYKRLKWLEKKELIGMESNNKNTIVSICNYDSYQDTGTTKEQRSNNEVTTGEQQGSTKKNNKNIKEIYNTYPTKCPVGGRSTGKNSKNKNKIESLLKKHDKDYLVKLINLYIKDCTNTNTYIKNFTTFLNNLPDIEQFNVIQQNKQIKTETIEEYKARIAG